MVIRASKKDLEKAVKKAIKVIDKRSALPALQGFLLHAEKGKLTLRATNLETFISITVPVDVVKSGTVLVDAKRLVNIVDNAADELYIEEKDKELAIKTGRSSFRLYKQDPEDFVEFPELVEGQSTISSVLLERAVKKVLYAVADDDGREPLKGVFIDGNRFVASNGYMLAVFETQSNQDKFVIKGSALKLLLKVISDLAEDIYLSKSESFVFISGENWFMAVRGLEGEYPDYRSVLDRAYQNALAQAIVDRKALIESLERALLLNEYASLTFSGDKLIVEVIGEEGEGVDEMDIEYDGQELKLGVRVEDFLDALEHCDGEKVVIKLSDDESAFVVESDKEIDPYTCLLMPVKL